MTEPTPAETLIAALFPGMEERNGHLFRGGTKILDEDTVTLTAGSVAMMMKSFRSILDLAQATDDRSRAAMHEATEGATLSEVSVIVHDPITGRVAGSRRYRLPQPPVVETVSRPAVTETVIRQ